MSESKKHFHATKLKPLVQVIVNIIKKQPEMIDNPEYLMATIAANIPGFNDASTCVNCGASMAEYVFEFDVLDALLLLAMAREVREKMLQPKNTQFKDDHSVTTFTEANQVKVQSLGGVSYAMKSRTTKCAKLGLIAKYKSNTGRHLPGTWVITKRGWDALRGEPVPKAVKVFRGQILERTDDLTTLRDIFYTYGQKISSMIRRKKTPKTDHRSELEGFNPSDWVQIGGMHEGELL